MTRFDDIVGVTVGALAAAGLAAAMALAPHGVPHLIASEQGPGWFAYAPRAGSAFISDLPVCLDRPGSVHLTGAELHGATVSTAILTDTDGRPLTAGLDITTVCPDPAEPPRTRAYTPTASTVQVRATEAGAFTSAPTFARLHYVTRGEQAHLDVQLPPLTPGTTP